MRALRLDAPGKIRMISLSDPSAPGPAEAVIRIRQVGICGTDYHAFHGNQPFFTYPRILGHELGVEIVAVGTEVHHLAQGDHCAVRPYLACGSCPACLRDQPNCCVYLQVFGVHVDGGLREFAALPAAYLHPASTLTFEQLALVEPLAIGAHAVAGAALVKGERILVVGVGPIGLAVTQFALLMGAQVIVTDISQQRLAFCQNLWPAVMCIDGHEPVVEALERFMGDDFPTVVFDATGSPQSMQASFTYVGYGGRVAPQHIEGRVLQFDEETLVRAAVKYGGAIAHVARLYRHLATVGSGHAWEVEVSVDETETPTTHAEHLYFATELRRLGVRWVSLAPRYIGRFEKGVDYIGDPDTFSANVAIHAAIARTLGPYKLSLHSGSDKFSSYEIAARETQGMVHLKTAGTSYLEALRTVAQVQPGLLRDIYTFALECYATDRASYHVSAELHRAPAPMALPDTAVSTLLDQFDARQILHVTFGSVLTAQDSSGRRRFYDRMMEVLQTHSEVYAANLKSHFLRHLRPFVAYSKETRG